MYGETGTTLRTELAALLRQHRVQQRIGGPDSRGRGTLGPAERERISRTIMSYRRSILAWCVGALASAEPVAYSNLTPATRNPFRSSEQSEGPIRALREALDTAAASAASDLATLGSLTLPSGNVVVERWRNAAKAAALAEHDTNGPDNAGRMTTPQAQALAADVAAVSRALVVLDQRYKNTPQWEPLADGGRIGWAALAVALDVSLGYPDYGVDSTGWRPPRRPIEGSARPGILGVLQAEHNLLVLMVGVPTALNLRSIVNSQMVVSAVLAPHAQGVNDEYAHEWTTRATTYRQLAHDLRGIDGQLGGGNHAVAEANAAVQRVAGLSAAPPVEPRTLDGLRTVFRTIDSRIATVIDDGVRNGHYLQAVTLPRIDTAAPGLIKPVRERYVRPQSPTDLPVVRTARERLRPGPQPAALPAAGQSRAELHAALIHRPPSKGVMSDVRGL
jgi:hypothetical protein